MSWQATNWAMRETSTHGDARAKLVLMCLADYARPDGTGAYPTVKSIVAMTEIPERTVRRKLALLRDMGLIRMGDQRIVAGYSKDKRPIVYDLAMSLRESGMDEASEQARIMEANQTRRADAMATTEPEDATGTTPETGCQNDTPHDNKEQRHAKMAPRTSERGATGDTPRGAKMAPKRIINNQNKIPPIAPQGARRHEIPNDWRPTPDTRALAAGLGLDCDSEAERFRLHAKANRRRLADWDTGFELWLKTTASRHTPGEPPRKPHTHSWACEHTKRILARFGIDPASELDLAQHVATRLKAGDSEDAITDMLAEQREREWLETA